MIDIKKSDITFDKVYNDEYSPRDVEFRKANCLILPYKNFRDGVDYCFSEYAQEVLQYSKENPCDDIIMDIAATDENYKVIEMHSVLLQIGIFVASSIILPSVINLVTSYAYDKIKQLHHKKEDVEVRVTYISILPDGTSRALNYVGPADKIEEITQRLELMTNPEILLPDGEEDEKI
jgi:hypothetical protein